MKINLHKSPLFFYIYINELDSLRKFSLFEDYDETLENYNSNSLKRPLFLEKKIEEIPLEKAFKEKKIINNFFSEYFNNVKY